MQFNVCKALLVEVSMCTMLDSSVVQGQGDVLCEVVCHTCFIPSLAGAPVEVISCSAWLRHLSWALVFVCLLS